MAKKLKPIPNLVQKLKYGKIITLVILLGMILFFVLTKTLSHNTSITTALIIWLAQSLPLILLIPGIVINYYRSYSWLCFVLLFYFVFAVERCFLSTASWEEYIFVTLTVILFISSMMTSRWQQRSLYQEA